MATNENMEKTTAVEKLDPVLFTLGSIPIGALYYVHWPSGNVWASPPPVAKVQREAVPDCITLPARRFITLG